MEGGRGVEVERREERSRDGEEREKGEEWRGGLVMPDD